MQTHTFTFGVCVCVCLATIALGRGKYLCLPFGEWSNLFGVGANCFRVPPSLCVQCVMVQLEPKLVWLPAEEVLAALFVRS